MGKRLNIERQNELEPDRMKYAIKKITELGFEITDNDGKSIEFIFKKAPVRLFPYSGWHTGKTIQDGRGISKLLKQLK